jgi:hypothetical protein
MSFQLIERRVDAARQPAQTEKGSTGWRAEPDLPQG